MGRPRRGAEIVVPFRTGIECRGAIPHRNVASCLHWVQSVDINALPAPGKAERDKSGRLVATCKHCCDLAGEAHSHSPGRGGGKKPPGEWVHVVHVQGVGAGDGPLSIPSGASTHVVLRVQQMPAPS